MKLPASALLKLVEQERAPQTGNRWLMLADGNEDGSINKTKLTRNTISVALYRGQNHHFDPCWASLCRGFHRNTPRVADLAPIDQARLLHRLALNRWFADELAKHPMMKWAKSEGIIVDAIAIAQHYGIPTAYVDLSESFAIAAFFATCRFTSSQTWEPMTSGTGVMYNLHFNAIDERIAPICYQPLPRPSQQWAWTVELRLGENFLQTPRLKGFEFEHNAKVGEEMLKRFEGGSKLFVPDPTARLAIAMCTTSEIPSSYIEEVESWFAKDPYGLPLEQIKHVRSTLRNKLKISLSNTSTVSYTQDELDIAEDDWLKSHHEFWKETCFRCTRPIKTNPLAE